MAKWLIEVVGITLFTTVFALLLPNGKTSKIIKCIFSIMCILVLIKPVLSLDFDGVFNMNNINAEISLDDNYLNYVKNKNQQNIKDYCDKILGENGLQIENFSLIYDDTGKNVTKINIKLKKQVIENEIEHINIIEKVKDTVAEFLYLKKENVIIYE